MVFSRFLTVLLLLLLTSLGHDALADVDSRPLLLSQRDELRTQLQRLASDSSALSVSEAHAISDQLIAIDNQIIASYNETLARISQQQRRRTSKERVLVFFSLLCCFVALASVLALYFANRRMDKENGVSLLQWYRQLFQDLSVTVRPDNLEAPTMAKVNPVVLIGVLFMAVSILVFLIGKIH